MRQRNRTERFVLSGRITIDYNAGSEKCYRRDSELLFNSTQLKINLGFQEISPSKIKVLDEEAFNYRVDNSEESLKSFTKALIKIREDIEKNVVPEKLDDLGKQILTQGSVNPSN
jgi:hypothetical protein